MVHCIAVCEFVTVSTPTKLTTGNDRLNVLKTRFLMTMVYLVH